MSRDLVLDVIARKNSRDLSTLADEFDKLARQTDDAGKKMHQTGTFSQFLDEQLAKTKAQVRELGEEFDRTGDKDVFAKLRGAQANQKSLERIKIDLSKALGDGGEAGGLAGARRFVMSFASAVKDPAAAGGIGAAGLVVGAFAGAAINGALLAGVASGGLALGIVGQAKNPAVRAAWADTGHFISGELTKATAGFEKPLVNAAHIIRNDIGQAIDDIHFSRLADEVEPLARGLGGLATHTVPGLNDALDAGAGILDKVANQLPSVGDAASDAFRKMSEGSKGAGEGLTTLLMAGKFLIRMTGDLALGLSKTYEWIVNVGVKLSWWADAIGHNIPILGGLTSALHDFFETVKGGDTGTEILVHKGETLADALRRAAEEAEHAEGGLDKLMQKISATTATTDTLAGAISAKLFSSMMNVDQATLTWHESLTQLGEVLTRQNHSIDENTAKGQANVAGIYAAVTANMQIYQAQVAAAHYDTNTQALRNQLHTAGLTWKEIDNLIGKYGQVPHEVNTDLAVNGLTDAINNLGNLIASVNGLNGRNFGFTVTETDIRRRINEDMGHAAHGGFIRGYASGGRVFKVGEQGRELLTLPAMSAPAYVTPNSTLNGSANGGAGPDLGTITVVVQSDTGEDLIRKIVTVGRRTNRTTFDTLLPVRTSR
jgi:hypothetical protein